MNIAWKISKGVLKLAWIMIKMAVFIVDTAFKTIDKSRAKDKASHVGWIMARELREKGEISSEEFHDAFEP